MGNAAGDLERAMAKNLSLLSMDGERPIDLNDWMLLSVWLERHAGPFFETKPSLDWFVKRHRRELIEADALLPREGRAGSLVSVERFPKAVIEILKRRAISKAGEEAGE